MKLVGKARLVNVVGAGGEMSFLSGSVSGGWPTRIDEAVPDNLPDVGEV
jgi:hypothetical protein